MTTTTPRTANTTHTAGFPPAPPEAHQRAVGETSRVVVMNGSVIAMELSSLGWVNRLVRAA